MACSTLAASHCQPAPLLRVRPCSADLRCAVEQVAVIGNQSREVVLDVVDAYAEGVMTDEKRADDARRIPEKHRYFRPEVAVEQVPGAVVQGTIEGLQVDFVEQVAQRRQLLDALQHLLRGHHQLQQGGEGGDALLHKAQIVDEVVQAEAEIFFFGPIAAQLVDAVAQPMVVLAPVFLGDEIVEGFLDHLQPAFVATQAIETHQPEGGFAVVVDNPERRFDTQVVGMQDVVEAAGLRILHPGDTVG